MSEDEESKSAAGRWITIVAVSLVLYVLSIGPVVALKMKYPPSPTLEKRFSQFLVVFYYPIGLLDETPMRNYLHRYVEWWCKAMR